MKKKIMIVATIGTIGSFAYWISRAQTPQMPQPAFPSMANPGAISPSHGVPDMHHNAHSSAASTTSPYSQAPTTTPPAFYNATQSSIPSQGAPMVSSSFVPNPSNVPQSSSAPYSSSSTPYSSTPYQSSYSPSSSSYGSQSMPMQGSMNTFSNPTQQNAPAIIIKAPNELQILISKVKNNIAEAAKNIPSEIDAQNDKQKFIDVIDQERANQTQELKQIQALDKTLSKSESIPKTEWPTFKTNVERVYKATLVLDYINQLEDKIK